MIRTVHVILLLYVFYVPLVFLSPHDPTDQIPNTESLNKSSAYVEATLTHRSGSGVIQIFLPNVPGSHPVCYPETHLEQTEAARLIHVLCKQLGYVTFGSRYKEVYPAQRHGVLSTSAQCTGLEDRVSHCSWEIIKRKRCQEVLATKCTSCNHKVFASNGSIHNPGFPHAYLYSMTCEWTVEVPEDLIINLHFEQFSLPQIETHDCESYIEFTYGYQKSLTHQKLCPSDLPDIIIIPYRSVRIRFSAGVYQQKYRKQQSHYGFNIVFRTVIPSSDQSFKAILISAILLSSLVLGLVCLCCRRIKPVPNQPALPLAPNAPAQDELQAAFEFQRCAMQSSQNKPQDLDFSIYQSDGSSMDSNIARWRSQPTLPVTSALAPLGPDTRMISIASTPRTGLPETRRNWTEDNTRRIRQLRTKLVARFSSTSSNNRSDISVFLPSSERRSYRKLSCEDIPLQPVVRNSNKENEPEGSLPPKGIPNIVIEFVK